MTGSPSPAFPVSVKGIVRIADQFVLLENDRGSWELPGGRLEAGEQPEQTLAREIEEELNIEARIGSLISAYMFDPVPGRSVLILVYDTRIENAATLAISDEHRALGLFNLAEMADLDLPQGYRDAISLACATGQGSSLGPSLGPSVGPSVDQGVLDLSYQR